MAKIATTGAGEAPTSVESMSDRVASGYRSAAEQAVSAGREAATRIEASAKAGAPALLSLVNQDSSKKTAEARRTFLDVAGEQVRHNLATMMALAGTLDWSRLLQIQAEYLRDSFNRSTRLTQLVLATRPTASVPDAAATFRQV